MKVYQPQDLNINVLGDVWYFGHWFHAIVTKVTEKRATVVFHTGKDKRRTRRERTVPLDRFRPSYATQDALARSLTAFTSLDDMTDRRHGDYRPTLLGGGLVTILADAYDRRQRQNGSEKRAWRGHGG